jgi:hypothetical protein
MVAPLKNTLGKMNEVEHCPVVDVQDENEPYCFEKAVVKEINKNINNDTSFKINVRAISK